MYMNLFSSEIPSSERNRLYRRVKMGIPLLNLVGMPFLNKAVARTLQMNGKTNEIISVVDGIRHKRLGGADIVVSEIGLGTQR